MGPSERVAIAEAVRAEIGSRQGQRTDQSEVETTQAQLPQNIAEVRGAETREIAAQKAGFGNPETYRQAKQVVEHGTPTLVKSCDYHF